MFVLSAKKVAVGGDSTVPCEQWLLFRGVGSLRSMAVLSGARLSEAANTRRARTGGKAETKSSSSSCSRLNLYAVSLPSPALII